MEKKALHIILISMLCSVFGFAPDYLNATNVDSLQLLVAKYEKSENIEGMMDVQHQIGDYFFYQKEYQQAIEAYKSSKKNAEELEEADMIAQNLYKIGRMYGTLQNNSVMLEHLLEAAKVMDSLKEPDFKLLGKTLNYISKTYQKISNFELAYEYQLRALRVFEDLQDTTSIAISHYELGNVFFYQERYRTAIDSYQKGKELAEKQNVMGLLMATIGSIGSAYDRLEETEKSLEFNLKALEIAEANELERQVGDALHNVASNYHILGNFEEALEKYRKALKIKRAHNDKFAEAGTLRGISSVYLDAGKVDKALSYLHQALDVANEIDSDTRRLDVYFRIANAYEQKGLPLRAYQYMKEYVSLKDSVMNQNTVEMMSEAKTRYEVEKREKEINFLKKENELLEKDKELTSLRLSAFGGLILGLLLLLILCFFYYRNQKRYNKLLEEKNIQIEKQNTQLEVVNQRLEKVNQTQKVFNEVLASKNWKIEQQNKQLENSNEELKQFAYVASHDLKEPLRMISSYTSLIQRRYVRNLDEGAKEFMGYITDATKRMNNLLEDLLSYSRISTHNQKREQVDMNHVLEGVLANLHLYIEQKGAKIDLDDLPKIEASRPQMGQLYQNLISNAIKFSDEDHPKINIQSRKNGTMHIFSVSDNGIGIAAEHQKKIFDMFSRLHTRDEYEGTGIGLATCKKIVERHGGNIWVESEEGKGSTFYFALPFDHGEVLYSKVSSSLENV